MLAEGTIAPTLSEDDSWPVEDIDGWNVDLVQLHQQGPIFVVLIRGFT
ncbi:MAG: hypothetical protein JRI55_38570 [Deltaproteobacteria bacterium]|jgi:hypothetical protein|nr:hypothetical protein [Deltaproteobacteria bacterium]